MNGNEEYKTRSKRRQSSNERISFLSLRNKKKRNKSAEESGKKHVKTREHCKTCQKAFKDFLHRVNHECRPFQCRLCPETFASDAEMFKHKINHNKNLDKMRLYENHHPKTLNLKQSVISFDSQHCPNCNINFSSAAAFENHKFSCNNKNFKSCVLCAKRIRSVNKGIYCPSCERCINGKDYSLRRKSKDKSNENASRESFLKNKDAEITGFSPLNIEVNGSYKPSVLNYIPNTNQIDSEKFLSLKKLDSHKTDINIRKVFAKCTEKNHKANSKRTLLIKKPLPVKLLEANEQTDSVKQSPLDKHLPNKPKLTIKKDVIAKPKDKKNDRISKEMTSIKLQAHFTRQKRDVRKPESNAEEKENPSSESTITSIPDKLAKENKSSSDSNEIKLESLIHLLPDSGSGVLIKHLVGNSVNYKCIKCNKIFGATQAGSLHILCCKSKLKKTSVSLDKIIWLCTFCHNKFNILSELLKHKLICTNSSLPSSTESKNLTDESSKSKLIEKNTVCKKCGLTCVSNWTLQNHPCQERLEKFRNCSVKVDQVRELDKNTQTVIFYHCKICEKDFVESHVYRVHMIKYHPEQFDGTVEPLSLRIRKNDIKPIIKYEPISVIPLESLTNYLSPVINRTFSAETDQFTDLNSMNDMSSSSQHQLCEPSTSEYQYLLPINQSSSTLKEASMKKLFECVCSHNKSKNLRYPEDVKPCVECLKTYSKKNFFKNVLSPSANNENESYRSRPFLTPPMTPESKSSSSPHNSSDLQPNSITNNPSSFQKFDCPQTNATPLEETSPNVSSDITIQAEETSAEDQGITEEINFANFKFSDDAHVDVFAYVNSKNDLSIVNYICADCYKICEKNEIITHLSKEHNNTSGVANLAYVNLSTCESPADENKKT